MFCPQCQSGSVLSRDLARRTGGVLGAAAGGIAGATGAITGAELGGAFGLVAGPPGMVLGSIAGALLGAFVTGTTGCIAGARLGELIDENILNNYQCQECGYQFSTGCGVPEYPM
jgi:hypothetical protein